MSAATADSIDKEVVRMAAAGRWREILQNVAGIPPELLDSSQEHPCPKCGGDTRFRLVDEAAGAVYCSHCFYEKCGDGFAAVGWMLSVNFRESLSRVANYVGYASSGFAASGRSTSDFGSQLNGEALLHQICGAKRMPVDSAKAFGAKATSWGSDRCVEFPYYDATLVQCSRFALKLDGGKGWNAKGQPTGLFMPQDGDGMVIHPQPGELWIGDEGVKNPAAMHGLGYRAFGWNGSQMKAEHASVFRGVHIMLTPNLDAAGQKGAAKNTKLLEGIAASVKIARLPGAIGDNLDVRDVLAKPGGELLVRQAITGASSGQPSDAEATVEAVRVTPSSEFFKATYRREWIVEGVMTAGEPCVWGARAKGMKTTLAVDLALSIGAGVPWLERFPTTRRTVAVLSGESGQFTLQETARRIASAKGINPALGSVLWGFRLPCLGDPDGLESLEMMLLEQKPEVLIVDPVYLSLMGNSTRGLSAGNLFDIGPLLAGIVDTCLRRQTTPILIHHCRKNSSLERFAPPELEELAMAGFGEFARQWVLLGRRSEYQSDGHHELWMQVGGSAGHGGLYALDINEGRIDDSEGRRWEVSLHNAQDVRETAKKAKAEAKAKSRADQLDGDKRAVCGTLAAMPDQTGSKSAIRDRAGLNTARVATAIADLLKQDSIITIRFINPGNKQEMDGYKLAVEVDEIQSQQHHPGSPGITRTTAIGQVVSESDAPGVGQGGM